MDMWNESAEQIMAFTEHCGMTFAITVQEMPTIEIYDTQSKDDFRQEIWFRGYLPEESMINRMPNQISVMRCFIHYRYDYDRLIRNYMYIHDFTVSLQKQGKGFGSLIMRNVKQYALNSNLEYISGRLSEVDTSPQMGNRREMLEHFYRKHGFIIDRSDHLYCSLLNV